ncbi:MAG TPA: response regulator transcription factor [Elusimicrobiales bacterium]|nr:response regulator transcription factor [Elusimicrobiales bacterium]
MTIKVIIADDHSLVIEGLKPLLEKKSRDIVITGQATDGKKFLELARKKPADVYLLDIAMPSLNGIDAAARLIRSDKTAKIIFLSMYDDRSTVEKAMKTGAKGYILKESAADELIKAVREVSRGGYYLSPALHSFMAESLQNRDRAGLTPPRSGLLTSKEREIVQLIAEGLANKQIAREMKISANTVHAHRSNIAHKLNIHKQTDLVRYAIKEKLVKL